MSIIRASIWMDKPPQMYEREWRSIQRDSLSEMAAKWHKEILPRHFTRAAPAKYNHQPRTVGYLRRKRKLATRGGTRVKYGGMIDNVFTGDMESRLKQLAQISAANYRTVSLTMKGPRYMTMRRFAGDRSRAVREGWTYGKGKKFRAQGRGSGLQPDKVREITTQTPEELHELTVFLNDRVAARWRAWKATRKIA